MEKINNKNKNVVSIIISIALYFAMAFSIFPTMDQVYNLLAFNSDEMIQMLDMSLMGKTIKYITPFISSAILYILYNAYIKVILRGANGRMAPFRFSITKEGCRRLIDPCFIVLCILLGILGIIFNNYPYWSTLLQTPLRLICVIGALVVAFLRMTKSLDKVFYPIVLDAFVWPSIIVVVLI